MFNEYIKSDLYRCTGTIGYKDFFHRLYADPGFKFLYFFRQSSKHSRSTFLGIIFYFFYKRYTIKYNIQIPRTVKMGKGIAIPHFGGIVINSGCIIGNNCNILQGVTLGSTKRGIKSGVPRVGNNVYFGPNSVVVGGISIGNNVLIAPNAFVNFDVPDNSIAIGNPAKIISKNNATDGYITNFIDDVC